MCVLYFLIFYTIYAYVAGRKSGVKKFYKNILPVVLTSFATQSSLASLPTNLEVTGNMDIPKDIREVTLPIGTTMHMEGSSMGSILKIAFLFSIFKMSFTGIDTYLIAIFIAVLSSIVMSGIPGGALIGEVLIVSFSSAVPYPWTMMIESFNAVITIATMSRPHWSYYGTSSAKLIRS